MQYYDKKTVGKRIQKMRKSRNMTQCVLAEKLDYTKERQLQRIESGETACSVDKLMEIAQILEISTDYLLFGVERVVEDRLYTIFEGKTEGQKRYLEKLLKAAADNIKILELL